MTQAHLDRAVARVTGEDPATIARLGFVVLTRGPVEREDPVLPGDRAVLGPFPSVSPGPRVLRAIAGAVIGKARPLIDALALRSGQSRGRRQPRARHRRRRYGPSRP